MIAAATRSPHPLDGHAYAGAELCEALLPTPSALVATCRASLESSGAFTFATPPVGDRALTRVRALLEALAAEGADVEVVVNDWGVLGLVREQRGRFTPTLGRLMNKMLRDPRVTRRLDPAGFTGEALRVLRQSSLTVGAYAALLRSWGVVWVELDNLYQGIDIDFDALGLRPSVHLPFGCVTTGPACFFAGTYQPKHTKFANDTPCRRECQTYVAKMIDRHAGTELLACGNSVFYRQAREHVDAALDWVEARAGRVVLHPRPVSDSAFVTSDMRSARRWLEVHHD